MIKRQVEELVKEFLQSDKAIIVIGARQVGKSTLLKTIFSDTKNVLWLNGDEVDVRNLIGNISSTRLSSIIGDNKYVIIDEAQRIQDIGLILKIIKDNMPSVKLIVTGSSSFQLANNINEPLTGRKFEIKMFPLSYAEMVKHNGLLAENRMLPERLVYGYYPDVINNPLMGRDILGSLSDSYLYKDILAFERVSKPQVLVKLLQALALQVGSQVSYKELGDTVGVDMKTAERYIQLLEKCYVIFFLSSFSRNHRNELKKSKKIYFYDNGIRNAVIGNFSPIETRPGTELGMLWENFIISERIKKKSYERLWGYSWFWRTSQQQEIDYIEEIDGKISAFEFKWNPRAKVRIPLSFRNAYPNADFKVITPNNIEEFLL